MSYSKGSDDPREVYLKINKAIFSCDKIEQLENCRNLIENFKMIYGNYDDGEYSVKQLYYNLSETGYRIRSSNELKRITEQKPEIVEFFIDRKTNEVFAYFFEFKTKRPNVLGLCYFKGHYCELRLDYISRCDPALYCDYKSLYKKLDSKKKIFIVDRLIHPN